MKRLKNELNALVIWGVESICASLEPDLAAAAKQRLSPRWLISRQYSCRDVCRF
ncbi:hypothetical protein ACNKHM_28605 [Shigella sonnei]